MKSLSATIKTRVVKFVQTTPVITDIYHSLKFPTQKRFCRGVYPTYVAAQNAIPERYNVGYNTALAHPDSLDGLDVLRAINEPLRSPLQAALKENSRVFDLGGGVGIDYYAFRKALDLPEGLEWIVCDIPSAVEAGRRLAEQHRERALSFTVDFQEAEGADILLTNGSLQYIEPSLDSLIDQLMTKPHHLFINYIPCHEGETFFTVQNIIVTRCPYKIQKRAEFVSDIEQLGYQLVESWHEPRTCYIPFHPEYFVRGYHGFYFKLNTGQ